jgi:penicillin amidase
MSKFFKVIIGISIVLITLLIAVIIFSYRLVYRSLPQIEGRIFVQTLIDSVEIYRDENGIPHIFARNEYDMYFALGFVTAQDRIWQMDLSRRIAAGRLSEIFGEEMIGIDKLFRTIGISRIAESIQKSLSTKSIEIIGAYTDGVNFYIQTHRGRFPVEFDLLDYEPEEWSIKDCIMISRLMAWRLNFSWLIEPVFTEIASLVGESKLKSIIPVYPEDAPLILERWILGGVTKFVQANIEFRGKFAPISGGLGSNSWVVSGKRTKSGKPLLANDPHLPFSVPSIWYQVHLNDGKIDIMGVSLPGAPGVVIGRNNYIAWGLTNVMLDDTDFYIEKLDSTRTRYLFNGQWRDLKFRDEVIKVKGGKEIKFKVAETHRGPIISDIYGFSFGEYIRQPVDTFITGRAISMRWVGSEISDEALAIYKINHARNWREFVSGLKHFATPAQNFIYADVNGNIGYYCAGLIPIRRRLNPLFFNPGETDRYDWIGFVPFDKLPNVLNPKEGMLATANNKVVSDRYPYYISYIWEPESRIVRIKEMLKSKDKFSVEDFKKMQFDYISPYARELVPYIIKAIKNVDIEGDRYLKRAVEYLKGWDFNFSAESVATSVFNAFLIHMMKNTFKDEFGDELYKRFIFYSGIPLRILKQLIISGDTLWFDDVRTEQVETMDMVIASSFIDGVRYLRENFGDEISTWQWGRIHKLKLAHPFGSKSPADKIFNVGEFRVGGSSTTVNNTGYNMLKPFDCVQGASMRQIVDLADSSIYSIIPTGASGQIMSKFYENQTERYIRGEYLRIEISRDKIKTPESKLLKLIPLE